MRLAEMIYTEEEMQELREENRNLKEKLSEITMVSDDEKQSIEHILELEEENRKLKAEIEIRKLTAKDYAKLCWVELDDYLNI